MMESVDITDLKSVALKRPGSSPGGSTKMKKLWSKIKSFFETRDPGDLSKHRLYSDRYEDMRM